MLEPRSQVVVGEAAHGLRRLGSLLMRYASHLVFLLAKYPATEIEDRPAPRIFACGRVSTPRVPGSTEPDHDCPSFHLDIDCVVTVDEPAERRATVDFVLVRLGRYAGQSNVLVDSKRLAVVDQAHLPGTQAVLLGRRLVALRKLYA